MKKFLLIFIAVLMIVAVGCGAGEQNDDNSNTNPTDKPENTDTYVCSGVTDGFEDARLVLSKDGKCELITCTQKTEFDNDDINSLLSEDGEPAGLQGEIVIKSNMIFTGTYTQDGNKCQLNLSGKVYMSIDVIGQDRDKFIPLYLEKAKKYNEEMYNMYKQAIESRYDYSEESEGATIDADVELKDNNFIMLEVNGYENSKLAMKQEYNNGIIVKNTVYSNGVVYSEKTYNEAGKIIEQKRFDDQGNVTSNTTYGYDNRGNLIASNRYQNGELQENEKWEYDTNNNEILSEHYVLGDLISKEVSEYTSDNIRIKFYVYTQEGLVSSEEVDAVTGECIRKEYIGDQVSREEKFDSDGVQLYKYDYENGILKYKEIFTNGKVTMYENYNNGIITTHIEYEYNSTGEASKRTESYYNDNGELAVVVYYENDKRVLEEQYENGQVTSFEKYEYDSQGFQIRYEYYIGNELFIKTDYTNDAEGNTIKYVTYDGENNLVSEVEFDKEGNKLKEIYHNDDGFKRIYTYNPEDSSYTEQVINLGNGDYYIRYYDNENNVVREEIGNIYK